jgi:hypothetical protein
LPGEELSGFTHSGLLSFIKDQGRLAAKSARVIKSSAWCSETLTRLTGQKRLCQSGGKYQAWM